MSLRHILLGMVREPQSGYDIKKHFNKSLKNFWNANLSQIYPLLQKLEDDGLVASKMIDSASGPPRREYRRTKKGFRELANWLAAGPKINEERIGYLAQVYFLHELSDPQDRIDFMQALRAHMYSWLTELESVRDGWAKEDPRYPDALDDQEFFSSLTLDLGIRKIRTNVEWCDASIEKLQQRAKRTRQKKSA